MRNLKKFLALALALALTLSLFCVSAFAANVEDYTDSEELAYVEQVDVLSALQIVEGDETGAFNPKENITRAEAATIIARFALSRKIADNMTDATVSRFTDMDQAAWAIKYVEVCADMGIIHGVGDNRFNPTGMVTGYEFAKMLLATIGYGQNDEYIGSSWALNVAIDAFGVNLFDGTDATDLTAPATREQCALYAFNALTNVDMVEYSALLDIYTSTGLFNNQKGITLGEKLYGLGCATTSELNVPNSKGVYTVGNVKMTGDLAESIGRSLRVWYTSDNYGNATAISNAYYDDVVLGSNHYGYTYAAMTTPGKTGYICKADSDIAVYVNGSRYDAQGDRYTTADVGGTKGVEVTFIDTCVNGLYDGVADKVFVLEKQVAKLTNDPIVRVLSDNTTVTIPGVTTGYLDVNNVIGYEDLSYGDVVLYWTDATGTLRIEKADSFTGELTGTERLSDGGLGYVISGKTYILSDLIDTAALTYCMFDIPGAPTASFAEFVYYVDNGGYIVAAVPVEEDLSGYVVVAEMEVIEPQGVDSKAYAEALLIDMDGNKKIVTLNSVRVNAADLDENGITDSTVTYSGIGIGGNDLIDTTLGIGNYEINADVSALVGNTFWNFTETDNGCALSSVYAKTINGNVTEIGSLTRTDGDLNDVQNDKASFAAGLTGNDQTVFVVYNKSNNTYNTYKGVANVPNIELSSTSETGYISINGFVQYVFIGKNSIDASSAVSEKTAFLLSTIPIRNNYSSATNTGYGLYQAVVDGELTAIMVKMAASEVRAEGIGYKTVYYDGSYIVSMDDNSKGLAPQSGYAVSGYSLRLADNSAYSYTFKESTPAFIVDSDRSDDIKTAQIEDLRSDINDTVYVVIPNATSSTASFIVVYENDPAADVIITSQPEGAAYNVGDEPVALTVAATAVDSQSKYLSYQWYVGYDSNFKHAEAIDGATSATLSPEYISTETVGEYYYFAEITHTRSGMQTTYAISNPAVITIHGGVSAPVIRNVTGDTSISFGASSVPTLSVDVETPSQGTLRYQWYKGSTAIEGATSATLDLTGYVETSSLGANEFMVEVIHEIEGNPNIGRIVAYLIVTVVPADSTVVVSNEALTLTEDDVFFTAQLSEPVTGQVSFVINWFGGNGWTKVGEGVSNMVNASELNYTFEAAFNADGRYQVIYVINQEGYNSMTGDFTGTPSVLVDPTDPGEGTDPTDPADPGEGTDPTDPADPGEGTDPTDPADPSEGADPTAPADPSEGAAPTDPADPSEGTDPVV